MSRSLVALALLVALTSGACGQRYPDSAQREVRLGDRTWTVLLADRDGMRGMADFHGADGMLFDFDQDIDPTAVVFVMDGVAFPLDIAWFTDSGELVATATMAVCPAKPCPTYAAPGPYRWAIEAPPGAFGDIRPSDRLNVSP